MLIGIPAVLGPELLAKAAYAVVATSEPRLYGNVIIRKGVIYPRETA
jgi:L-fucose mutarotase